MLRFLIAPYKAALFGLPRPMYVLAVSSFIQFMGLMVMTVLALHLKVNLGYGEGTIGVIIAAKGIGSVIGAYLGGLLADRLDLRRQIAVSLVILALGVLGLTAGTMPWHFFLTLLAGSLGDGLQRPATQAAILRLCSEQDRMRGYAVNRLAVNLGIAISSAIAGLLFTVSVALVFVLEAAAALLAAALVLTQLPALPAQPRPKTADGADARSRPPLRNPRYLAFCFAMLLAGMVFFQLQVSYPLFLREHYGISPQMFGIMIALNCLAVVLIEPPLTNIFRRSNLYWVAGIGSFLLCLGHGILPWSTAIWLAFLGLAIWTIAEMFMFPGAMGLAQTYAGASQGRSGEYLGLYTTMFAVSGVVGPAVGGMIYGAFGGAMVWHVCLVVGVVVLALFAWLGRKDPAADARTSFQEQNATAS